jgi:hypothetical protein
MHIAEKWSLTRWINDQPPYHGTVEVQKQGPRKWLWTEHILTPVPESPPLPGMQSYVLVVKKGILEIYHNTGPSKGTVFQCFDLRDLKVPSTHHCREDIYRTTLPVFTPAHVCVVHHVTGPYKKYDMRSDYTAHEKL